MRISIEKAGNGFEVKVDGETVAKTDTMAQAVKARDSAWEAVRSGAPIDLPPTPKPKKRVVKKTTKPKKTKAKGG